MRKYYIDNIRTICILLLFPFHTCMIYNNWGELFYITGEPSVVAGTFVSLVYPWWMTLLFVLAGISSVYSLKKRTTGQYMMERRQKLLIPLISGLILIIPVQSYIADIFYNGYTGGYFEHYGIFFTRFTYLTGQDGGFTPGHLWFIAYLILISWLLLPVMSRYLKSEKKLNCDKFTIPVLLPLFLLIIAATPLGDIGGKSIGEFACCFALGFFVLSDEGVQERLMKNWVLLTTLFAAALALRLVLSSVTDGTGLLWGAEQRMVTWFGILAILGMGRRFLNKTNPALKYLSKAAFPLYYFHQSVLVIIGFFTLKLMDAPGLQFVIIMVMSFLITWLCYEVFRRFRVTAWLFGLKK